MSTAARDNHGAAPLQIGRTRIELPFKANGDLASKKYVRRYKQAWDDFTAAPLSIADTEFIDAYLVSETDPEETITGMAAFARTFASIPATQTVAGFVSLSRPTLTGSFPQVYGGYRVFKPDSTLESYDAYYAQTVTSDAGAPGLYPTGGTYTLTFSGSTTGALNYSDAAATVQTALNAITSVSNRGNCVVGGSYNSSGGLTITFNSYASGVMNTGSLTAGGAISYYVGSTNGGYTQAVDIGAVSGITGGTFTITIFGQTTAAIAYNASAATTKAALDALSEVSNRGNCTVTLPGSNTTILDSSAGHLLFTVSFSNAVFTATASSLTPSGSTITPSITDSVGVTQKLVFAAITATRDIYCASHGFTTSDSLYIKGGSTYYSAISGAKFSLPDVNTIRLVIAASDSYAAASTITEAGKRTRSGYKPGSFVTRCKRITEFYLAGVSPGIATDDDITAPESQGDSESILTAAFAGTGTINYQVGELAPWAGRIMALTKTTVSAADL